MGLAKLEKKTSETVVLCLIYFGLLFGDFVL